MLLFAVVILFSLQEANAAADRAAKTWQVSCYYLLFGKLYVFPLSLFSKYLKCIFEKIICNFLVFLKLKLHMNKVFQRIYKRSKSLQTNAKLIF